MTWNIKHIYSGVNLSDSTMHTLMLVCMLEVPIGIYVSEAVSARKVSHHTHYISYLCHLTVLVSIHICVCVCMHINIHMHEGVRDEYYTVHVTILYSTYASMYC